MGKEIPSVYETVVFQEWMSLSRLFCSKMIAVKICVPLYRETWTELPKISVVFSSLKNVVCCAAELENVAVMIKKKKAYVLVLDVLINTLFFILLFFKTSISHCLWTCFISDFGKIHMNKHPLAWMFEKEVCGGIFLIYKQQYSEVWKKEDLTKTI